MNPSEIRELEEKLGTSDGVTMEEYFTQLRQYLIDNFNEDKSIDTLKSELKEFYPNETNWSF